MPGVLLVDHFVSGSAPYQPVSADLAAELRLSGWDVLTASAAKGNLAFLTDVLKTIYVERRRYNIAHLAVFSGRAFLWAWAAGWLLRRLGKPYVLTLHGGALPSYSARRPRLVGQLLRPATAVTAPSPYLAQALRPFADHIEVVPNGLHLANYPFRLRERVQPHLIWIRAFRAHYRPAMAVDVVSRLAAQFPQIRLTFVGPDHHDGTLGALREHIRASGLADRIELIPGVPKSEIPAVLQRADIFLNTTDIDNTPTTVLEAMACGLCVVTTDAGGIPEITTPGADALVVPCGDTAAMAGAVRRILADPACAAALSRGGRARASTRDWRPVGERWHNLLTHALGGVSNPAAQTTVGPAA